HARRRVADLGAGADRARTVAPVMILQRARIVILTFTTAICAILLTSTSALAAPNDLNVKIDGIGTISGPLQIILLLTLMSFLPAVLVIMTSFTRITIVFHFLRQALGTQEMPSNQILIGLTLFLTAFIMAPVAGQINDRAVQPVLSGRITLTDAV